MSQTIVRDDDSGSLTRRTVLTGAAATAAATMTTTAPATAQSVDQKSQQDMIVFVQLSAALTGIDEKKLAPSFDAKRSDPGSDPVNIKRDFFVWLNDHRPAAFENLLRMMKESLTAENPTQSIIAKLQFQDDNTRMRSEIEAKYLARSIVLMWYLGAWYDPDDLETASKDPDPNRMINFAVISPQAYTQAWALRVAQAHPMGFSQMEFGYWHRQPNPPRDFIGKDIA